MIETIKTGIDGDLGKVQGATADEVSARSTPATLDEAQKGANSTECSVAGAARVMGQVGSVWHFLSGRNYGG